MTPREIIERIAGQHLNIPTLSACHTDSLDFHVLPVWSIRKALHAAYLAGMRAGRSSTAYARIHPLAASSDDDHDDDEHHHHDKEHRHE